MSEEQHQVDIDDDLPHFEAGASSGGACLNRHRGDTPKAGENKSCSHRWQSYLKMSESTGLYNWPKYESLSLRKSRIPSTSAWGLRSLKPPQEGDWDVKGDNFWEQNYHPYWHEAHHIVPNSILRNAIIDSVDGNEKLVKLIRCGLLGEKYNLNEKVNMVTLPLEKIIADALGLPRHRKRASDFNHKSYSDQVYSKVKKLLQPIKQHWDEHKKPKYKPMKDGIEKLSKSLYKQITSGSAASLDDLKIR